MSPADRLAHAVVAAATVASVALAAPAARAQDPGAAAPGRVGVGWHVGNGLGLYTADLIVQPVPRVALEVQLGYTRDHAWDANGSTYSVAPAVRAYLAPAGRSWFLAAGAPLTWKRSDDPYLGRLRWFQPGLFANVGHAWRFPGGLGIVVGAGIGWGPDVRIATPVETVVDDGYLGVNLEAGLRYTFL